MAVRQYDDVVGDDRYLEYATPAQRKYVLAVRKHGSVIEAAKALSVNRATINGCFQQLRIRAARMGYAPEFHQKYSVPPGQLFRGASIYFNKDGKPSGGWLKTDGDKLVRLKEAMELFVEELVDGVAPAKRVVNLRRNYEESLLVVYPMGDPHIGMYAWHQEAGEDFDLKIAAEDLRNAMGKLLDSSPRSREAVIINLGDFFHADNYQGVTARSGHPLDTDSRWPKVLRLGAHLMIDCVTMALQKHHTVTVRNVIGNHDDHTSVALSLIMDAYFRDNPRVTIDCNPSQFYYKKWGKCIIGATHGHSVKLHDLGGVMSHDCREWWSDTMYHYWYTGHIHQRAVQELPGGVLVEIFRTLAAKDAWGAGRGYRSGRDMYSITLDQEYGEVGRSRVDIRRARESG